MFTFYFREFIRSYRNPRWLPKLKLNISDSAIQGVPFCNNFSETDLLIYHGFPTRTKVNLRKFHNFACQNCGLAAILRTWFPSFLPNLVKIARTKACSMSFLRFSGSQNTIPSLKSKLDQFTIDNTQGQFFKLQVSGRYQPQKCWVGPTRKPQLDFLNDNVVGQAVPKAIRDGPKILRGWQACGITTFISLDYPCTLIDVKYSLYASHLLEIMLP